MFEERIKRKAILTMDNGNRVFAEIQIKPTRKSKFIDELEKECVADFNRSQPRAAFLAGCKYIINNTQKENESKVD